MKNMNKCQQNWQIQSYTFLCLVYYIKTFVTLKGTGSKRSYLHLIKNYIILKCSKWGLIL